MSMCCGDMLLHSLWWRQCVPLPYVAVVTLGGKQLGRVKKQK